MTTLAAPAPLELLVGTSTTVQIRPRYEGSNICTWIGFKHVNYLVEEAVLEHFRRAGMPARLLYEEHGLGLDLVALDTRIATALHMDDLATAEVTPTATDDGELAFTVGIAVDREGTPTKAVTSRVRVALRADEGSGPGRPAPAGLERFVVARLGGSNGEGPGVDAVLDRLVDGGNSFGWKWRIPYFYCHFNERMQMSGYLRQLEEVVDLFLADRGISIRELLEERRWIPVVPHSRIRLLDEALLEEELYTIYTVEDVFKDFTYTSRMDCYVVRDGEPVQTATGVITHGYAVIDNRRDWRLVNFDDRVLRALRGEGAAA